MAYEYKGARVRGRQAGDRWVEADIGNVTLDTLNREYSYVYLTLSHPSIDHLVYLDMADAEPWWPASPPWPTVLQWLASLGNQSLPTKDELPTSVEGRVRFSDAVRAGYKIERTLEIQHPAGQNQSKIDPDLVLTRADKRYLEMYQYCLVSVNGAIHRPAAGVDGFYVPGGAVSCDLANEHQVGLIDFKAVGAIKTYPITKDMLFKANPKQRYCDSVHLQLPVDTVGKTVIFVIAGYLHVLDGVYRKVGEELYQVDMANFMLFHRYAQMHKLIDMSSMVLDSYPGNDTQLTLSQLYSDENVEALMTLPQSFIVVLDAEDVFTARHYLEKSAINGKYYAGIMPDMPCIGYQGLTEVYWPNFDWGQWVISIDHNQRPHYQIDTTDWGRQPSVSEQQLSYNPWEWAKPYFLEIGRIK